MSNNEAENRAQSGLIPVNIPNAATLLTAIESALDESTGFQVATLNLDHVVKLRQDLEFRAAYERHSHVTADGNPIVWLSRLAGEPVDLVPGSELIDPICALAARKSVPVGFFGSQEDVLKRAAQILKERHPGLQVVAMDAPPMGFDPQGEAGIEAANGLLASGARICFLALGAPKQELLASVIATQAPSLGAISIGAGLDFIAGHQTRAPVWVRRLALEWLWRMAQNPRRLMMRYMSCLAVLPSLFLYALSLRRRRVE